MFDYQRPTPDEIPSWYILVRQVAFNGRFEVTSEGHQDPLHFGLYLTAMATMAVFLGLGWQIRGPSGFLWILPT